MNVFEQNENTILTQLKKYNGDLPAVSIKEAINEIEKKTYLGRALIEWYVMRIMSGEKQ